VSTDSIKECGIKTFGKSDYSIFKEGWSTYAYNFMIMTIIFQT